MGVEKQALVDFLAQRNIYANFIIEDQTLEIIVTMVQNEDIQKVFDYNDFTDKQLKEFANAMTGMNSDDIKDEVEKLTDNSLDAFSNLSLSGYEKYKHEQATFIVIDNFKNINNAPVYGRQYTTVINGQGINISLNSYGSEVTDEAAQILKDTVASIKFTKVEKSPNKPFKIDMYKAVEAGLICACVLGGGTLLFFLINNRRKKKETNGQDSA